MGEFGGRELFSQAATEVVRLVLKNYMSDERVRKAMTAPGLIALRRMAKTATVSPAGDLTFGNPADEKWWLLWKYGSSTSDPLPIEGMIMQGIEML